MRGPFPFAPLQSGIQLQAQRHWGLSEDLAEEEGAPGQHLAPPSSYWAMHKVSHQPPALRPGPLQWGGGSADPCPGASSGLESRTGTDGSWHCSRALRVPCPMCAPACAVFPWLWGSWFSRGACASAPWDLPPIPGGCTGSAGATQGWGGLGSRHGSWTHPGWCRAGREDAPRQCLPSNSWGGGGIGCPRSLPLLSWVLMPPNQLSLTADPGSYKTPGSSSPAPLPAAWQLRGARGAQAESRGAAGDPGEPCGGPPQPCCPVPAPAPRWLATACCHPP